MLYSVPLQVDLHGLAGTGSYIRTSFILYSALLKFILDTRIGKGGTAFVLYPALLILVLDARCWYCIYIVIGSAPS